MLQLRSETLASILACLLLASTATPATSAEDPADVKLLQTWRGEVVLELRKLAPEAGYIADAKSWEKLWKAYSVQEVPTVDFKEHLILVGVNSDPNQIGAVAKLSEKGDLTVMYFGTLIGFEGHKTCAYQFAKIGRKGIKSVNGKPIPANKPSE